MEKSWLTVNDDHVDVEDCLTNQEQGWIPIEDTFQSGHMQPLAHPYCRCTALYRRKRGIEAPQPVVPRGPQVPRFGSARDARDWFSQRNISILDELPAEAERLLKGGNRQRKWTADDLQEYADAIGNMDAALRPEIMEGLRGMRLVSYRSADGTLGRTIAFEGGDIVGVDIHTRVSKSVAKDFVDLSPEGRIRHEIGHSIGFHRAELGIDWADIGFTVDPFKPSLYSNASISENWAELISLVTKPGFNIAALPEQTQAVVRRLLR
jgi:hypothetical protein